MYYVMEYWYSKTSTVYVCSQSQYSIQNAVWWYIKHVLNQYDYVKYTMWFEVTVFYSNEVNTFKPILT